MSESVPVTEGRLKQIDIATAHMPEMVKFYSEVFGFRFKELMISNYKHFVTNIGGIDFCLAPNEFANVSPNAEGVQQLTLQIPSLDAVIKRAKDFGVQAQLSKDMKSAFIPDPDGNPWMFTESK